jgi:hypothetical protein
VKETSHIFEACNPLHIPIPSIILPIKKKGGLYCSMQIKITKGYRREAVEIYKHVATYVAIFPVSGRSERRRKAPSPTEPLADMTARLLGMRETAPGPHGSSGMLSSQAFF